jgi:hypothetical protein
LSLCLTKHHALKAYCGSGGIAPRILDVGTRWRWVVSFTPGPLYPQEKSPRYITLKFPGNALWRDTRVSSDFDRNFLPDNVVNAPCIFSSHLPVTVVKCCVCTPQPLTLRHILLLKLCRGCLHLSVAIVWTRTSWWTSASREGVIRLKFQSAEAQAGVNEYLIVLLFQPVTSIASRELRSGIKVTSH